MLAKNPSELHKFYMEDSSFMHSESLQVYLKINALSRLSIRC